MKNMQTKSHLQVILYCQHRNQYDNHIMIEFRIKQLTFMRDEVIHMFIAVKFETTGSFDRNLRKRSNIWQINTPINFKSCSLWNYWILLGKNILWILLVAGGKEVEHSGHPQHYSEQKQHSKVVFDMN